MKIRTLISTVILTGILLVSCTDKKKVEKKSTTEIKTEVKSETKKVEVKSNTEKAERRRLDSIRQVKEHGHAH